MEVPQKLVTELPQDPAISLLGIYPKKTNTLKHTHTHTDSKRHTHPNVHRSIIYNSQNMEAT